MSFFWIALTALLFSGILWVLIAPIYLRVEWHDAGRLVQIHWLGIARASLLPSAGQWRLQVSLPFFRRSWPLAQLLSDQSRPPAEKPKPQTGKKRKWRPRHPFRLVRGLWRSFRLIRCRLQLDTDDYALNARLVPFFRLISGKPNVDCRINFLGKMEFSLLIDNRIYRMLYAVLRAI